MKAREDWFKEYWFIVFLMDKKLDLLIKAETWA